MRDIQLRAQSAPWNRAIEFMLIDRSFGKHAIGINVEMKDVGESPVIERPTFSLDVDQAQTLMDDLWNCGLRPTEGTGSAGALAATQKHLEDMRRLVFNKETS
jgi:hypothetical protein